MGNGKTWISPNQFFPPYIEIDLPAAHTPSFRASYAELCGSRLSAGWWGATGSGICHSPPSLPLTGLWIWKRQHQERSCGSLVIVEHHSCPLCLCVRTERQATNSFRPLFTWVCYRCQIYTQAKTPAVSCLKPQENTSESPFQDRPQSKILNCTPVTWVLQLEVGGGWRGK